MTDEELLDRFAASRDRDGEAAFRTLVERHGPMVWGVCRRVLCDVHEAEDAFQATFVILARKAGGLRDRTLLGNWLYGVAYRVAIRARSRAGRRRAREGQGAMNVMAAAEPGGEATPDDMGPVLHEEVRRLPEKYRAPVILCYLEGLSNEEAARRLLCPVGTVKVRLMRARERLRDRLSRRGLALSALMLLLLLEEESHASVPERLVDQTVRKVMRSGGFRQGPPGRRRPDWLRPALAILLILFGLTAFVHGGNFRRKGPRRAGAAGVEDLGRLVWPIGSAPEPAGCHPPPNP